MRDPGVTTTLEYVPERVEVVAHVGRRIDERIPHPGLRCEMHDAREGAVREKLRRLGGIGEIETLEGKLRSAPQLADSRLLERHVVVRLEVVDTHDDRTRIEERARGMHADEARRARDEDALAVKHGATHRPRVSASSAFSFAYLRKLANAPMAMCANPAAPSRKPSLKT